jgi:glyoxylase-like metal-dependent hydrolase (beta-lactamase superfamily II)
MVAPVGDHQSAQDFDLARADPVRSVKVLTTGTVEIHPQQVVGSMLPSYAWIAGSRRWLPPRPINAYLIEHELGLVLFDTGQDLASVTDPTYFPGGVTGWLYHRLARFHMRQADALSARLAEAGYRPSDVDVAILSHLHEDHIGGVGQLPTAQFLVSETEWRSMFRPAPELRGILRRHIDRPGLRVKALRFEPMADMSLAPAGEAFDVMGDGSLVLIPTPGHTAGSMSLLVRRLATPSLLLVGDLTYELEVLEAGRVPGIGNRASLLSTTARVLALRERHPGLVILPAHDPGAAARLRQASPQPHDSPPARAAVG